jgi:hypothetical protein
MMNFKEIKYSYPLIQVLFKFGEVKHKYCNLCHRFAEVMKCLSRIDSLSEWTVPLSLDEKLVKVTKNIFNKQEFFTFQLKKGQHVGADLLNLLIYALCT